MQNNLDILKNKTNSQNMSSAKKNEKDEKNNSLSLFGSKPKAWLDGLRSESGFQRMQTAADIVATIMTGGSGG